MNLKLKIENPNWKYIRRPHPAFRGGVQYIFTFNNRYQASVVKTEYSYGGEQDLWELAVLKDGALHYDNSVAEGDVRGHLTDKEVNELLREIERFGDIVEVYEKQYAKGFTYFGIRDVDTKQPLMFPNNDWLMFPDKESAEKVCRLINEKSV